MSIDAGGLNQTNFSWKLQRQVVLYTLTISPNKYPRERVFLTVGITRALGQLQEFGVCMYIYAAFNIMFENISTCNAILTHLN